jgi:hypothetical protein
MQLWPAQPQKRCSRAQTQQQQQRQFVRADSLSTLQEEQESELTALTKDVPRMEQRFEWLAFWVGAAVAFGAGIWCVALAG